MRSACKIDTIYRCIGVKDYLFLERTGDFVIVGDRCCEAGDASVGSINAHRLPYHTLWMPRRVCLSVSGEGVPLNGKEELRA